MSGSLGTRGCDASSFDTCREKSSGEVVCCYIGVYRCFQSVLARCPMLRSQGSYPHGAFVNEIDIRTPTVALGGRSSPKSPSLSTPKSPVFLRSDSGAYHSSGAWEGLNFEDRVQSLARARTNSTISNPGSDNLTLQLREQLRKQGLENRWRIPRQTRESLELHFGLNTDALMKKLTILAQDFAVPVISAFHVGSAALGASGDVYLGPNVEISSGAYASNPFGLRHTLHAEQAAILTLVGSGEKNLSALYVTHVPCGHCRQFMTELPNYKEIDIWSPQIGKAVKLASLLPYSFGPEDLGNPVALLHMRRNPIALAPDAEARLVDPLLAEEAERAAQHAYAPYTSSFAGIALRLLDGNIIRGFCVESVAFNPSVSPLQMALVALFARGCTVRDIHAVCLAESPSAPVSYKGTDATLLAAVAPSASLWVMPLIGEAALPSGAVTKERMASKAERSKSLKW